MLKAIRTFFEWISVISAALAVACIGVNLMEAAGLGHLIPYRNVIFELSKPFASAIFIGAVNSNNPLEVYPQASIVLFMTCLGASWVCTIVNRLDYRFARFNWSFATMLKWISTMNQTAMNVAKIGAEGRVGSMALIFMQIESPSADVEISRLVEEVLESLDSQDQVVLFSSQLDAYCFQTQSVTQGVKFAQALVAHMKTYNRALMHPNDAIRFMGVVHAVNSTFDLFEEDAYMRAVMSCCGRNQLLVSPEGRLAFQAEVNHAAKHQMALPELEMIYHGNYMSMGPRSQCDVYRIVKQF